MSVLTKVHVRWMIQRDISEVLAIEHASFEYPWCEEDFLRVLRQWNCIGMVAERTDRLDSVIGFHVYELHRDKIHVLDFAVDAKFRRHGIGTQLMEKLSGKLSAARRNRITIFLRESNLCGQLFCRQFGFLATHVDREHYPDTGEDGYEMTFQPVFD